MAFTTADPAIVVARVLDEHMRGRLVEVATEANPNLHGAGPADVLDLYEALAANPELAEWLGEHPEVDQSLGAVVYWAAKLLTQGFAANVKRMAHDILVAAEAGEQGIINRTHIWRRGT